MTRQELMERRLYNLRTSTVFVRTDILSSVLDDEFTIIQLKGKTVVEFTIKVHDEYYELRVPKRYVLATDCTGKVYHGIFTYDVDRLDNCIGELERLLDFTA